MPLDITFRDGDDGRSFILSLQKGAIDRIHQMIRLSQNCVSLNRTKFPTEPRELVIEALNAYRNFVDLRHANRELRLYRGEEQSCIDLTFETQEPETDAGGHLFASLLVCTLSNEGWKQFREMQHKDACAGGYELVSRALQYYEWGVTEAEKGFEIGSPIPGRGKVAIFFMKPA